MATAIPSNVAAFSVWDLAAASNGDVVRLGDEGACVRGVTTDSRAVTGGNAFVALRGASFDGHAFLGEAVKRGAAALVVERGREVPRDARIVVEVDDAVQALGDIARAHLRRWRQRSRRRVTAVTGSAGKTTTKDFIAAILSTFGCYCTTGNLNNRVGVPAVALALRDEPHAVFELGTSLPGEIALLADIVEPDVSVLLNVGVAHAEGFRGSRAAIAKEKGAILAALSATGTAIVNIDDGAARAQLVRTRARAVGFGVSPEADVRLVRREVTSCGHSRVTIGRLGRELDFTLPTIVGEAAALDLAAAIAAADAAVGETIPEQLIAVALASWRAPASRAVFLELTGQVCALDDSYNANPASMRAAFATLAELRRVRRGRAIAVLGEMRELGPLSEEEHAKLGVDLARHAFDLVVGCGGAIDVTLRHAAQGGVPVQHAEKAEDAGQIVTDYVRPGDVVLFKGSRGATVERALAALVARYPALVAPGAT